MVELKETNFGIACRIGDKIYINKKLKKYPLLYASILIHETKHSPGLENRDFALDIQNKELKGQKLTYWWFVITHPSSWVEFLPFWFYEGRIAISYMFMTLLACIIAVSLMFYVFSTNTIIWIGIIGLIILFSVWAGNKMVEHALKVPEDIRKPRKPRRRRRK